MLITYIVQDDLLYIQFDQRKQKVMDRRLSEDIVLELGDEDRIVGMEILDASKHMNLDSLLPIGYRIEKKAS